VWVCVGVSVHVPVHYGTVSIEMVVAVGSTS
jgi:hypothetical protein